MVHLIHHFFTPLRLVDGSELVVRVFGAPQPRGTAWDGWLVFFPVEGGKPLAGDRETSQATRGELEYWATGLEPVYLEGALERAMRTQGRTLLRRRAWGSRQAELIAEEEALYAALAPEATEPATPLS